MYVRIYILHVVYIHNLTLGTHVQQGLITVVVLCVCVSVCYHSSGYINGQVEVCIVTFSILTHNRFSKKCYVLMSHSPLAS